MGESRHGGGSEEAMASGSTGAANGDKIFDAQLNCGRLTGFVVGESEKDGGR